MTERLLEFYYIDFWIAINLLWRILFYYHCLKYMLRFLNYHFIWHQWLVPSALYQTYFVCKVFSFVLNYMLFKFKEKRDIIGPVCISKVCRTKEDWHELRTFPSTYFQNGQSLKCLLKPKSAQIVYSWCYTFPLI